MKMQVNSISAGKIALSRRSASQIAAFARKGRVLFVVAGQTLCVPQHRPSLRVGAVRLAQTTRPNPMRREAGKACYDAEKRYSMQVLRGFVVSPLLSDPAGQALILLPHISSSALVPQMMVRSVSF
jgi:hypothetical protein